MSLQRLYLPVGLETKTYSIPTFVAKIPWWILPACSGFVARSKEITWDEATTTVTNARLVITRVHSDGDPIDVWVRFNGTDLKRFLWKEGTKCTEKSDIIDVPLLNGQNILEIYACKMYPWIGIVTVTVSAYIEVTFDGEIPESPWWNEFWQWLESNWQWIAIGTGLIIVGGATYTYLAQKRR